MTDENASSRKRIISIPDSSKEEMFALTNMSESTDRHSMMPQKRLTRTGNWVSRLRREPWMMSQGNRRRLGKLRNRYPTEYNRVKSNRGTGKWADSFVQSADKDRSAGAFVNSAGKA